MTSKRIKTIGGVLVAVLILIQFFQIDKSNPTHDPAQDYLQIAQPSVSVQQMIKAACYDCHSHHTVYPWYTSIQPLGKWIKGHVDHGKEHLNFSIWSSYSPKKANHKLEECIEMLENKNMPLKSYTWLHPDSNLSEEQRNELLTWFKSQYQK